MRSRMFTTLLVLLLASLATSAMPATLATDPPPGIEQMHEEMLFNVALIRTVRGSGSGTVIYSAERDGEWATYILTNYHVISSAIRRQSICCDENGEKYDVERRSPVDVLFFEYNQLSQPIGNRGKRASIKAFDQLADLALLRLNDRENGAPFIARMHNPDDPLYMFERVWAVGAGLGEPPFATTGLLSRVDREIDGFSYIASSSPIIYGSSGGALFRYRVNDSSEHYELIGVTSMARAAGWQLVEHINFSIPMETIWEFLRAQCFGFIVGDEVEKSVCLQDDEK
jgi:S1-C subfamily serine protease